MFQNGTIKPGVLMLHVGSRWMSCVEEINQKDHYLRLGKEYLEELEALFQIIFLIEAVFSDICAKTI